MPKPLEGKRILSIIYGTALFGSERANLEALKAMSEQGAEIHVAVSGRVAGGGDVGEEARRCGFKTFEMPLGSHFAFNWMLKDHRYRRRQIKRIWTNSRLLSQKIKAIQPSHLLFSSVLSFMFCGLATVVHRTPLIYRIGDAPPADSRFQLFFWKWLVRRADHIVCVSDYIRKLVLERSGKNERLVTRIHNIPISRGGALDIQKCNDLRKSKCPLQLIFVGQISTIKGVDLLVEALIKKNDPDLGCWIIGGGKFTNTLESKLRYRYSSTQTRTSIEFLGYLDNPSIFYEAADLVIVPSNCDEALGNIVQEAALHKKASIISNRGGLPEMVIHSKTGLILKELSVEAMIETIEWSRDNVDLFEKMGENAFKFVTLHLSREKFSQQWVQVLNKSAENDG